MHPVVQLINNRIKSSSTTEGCKDKAEAIRMLRDLQIWFKREPDSRDIIQKFGKYIKNRSRNLIKRLDRIVSSEEKLKEGARITRDQLESIQSKSRVIACIKALILLQRDIGKLEGPDMGKRKDMQTMEDFPSMKAFIDISRKLGSTKDEIWKSATAAAIEQITWRENNGLEQFIKPQNRFSASRVDKSAIADHLDKGQAIFDIHVYVDKVWKKAAIYFFETSFEILTKVQPIFSGQRTAIRIETHYCPPQFVLKYSDGECTCKAENIGLRDEIVLMVQAFLIKGPDKGNMKGLQALRFFPTMLKYADTLDNSCTIPEIRKASVAAAIELTSRRVNDIGLEQGSKTETGFLADRIDEDEIAYYLDDEDHVFLVEVYVNNNWKSATLHFLDDSPLRIMVDGQKLVSAPHSTGVWVDIHTDEAHCLPELIVEFRGGASYTCRTRDASTRDEIVVAFKAFIVELMFHDPILRWMKPKKNWVKHNTNAIRALLGPGNKWGIGGLIRNESAEWVVGFWGRIVKEATLTELEFISLKKGLMIAASYDEEGETCIEIETNSKLIEDVLKGKAPIPKGIAWHNLAIECRKLLERLSGRFEVRTVGPAAMEAPFKLARMGC